MLPSLELLNFRLSPTFLNFHARTVSLVRQCWQAAGKLTRYCRSPETAGAVSHNQLSLSTQTTAVNTSCSVCAVLLGRRI